MKRFIACLVSFMLAFGLVPAPAFAESGNSLRALSATIEAQDDGGDIAAGTATFADARLFDVHEHTWTSYYIEMGSTCGAAGLKKRACTTCGEVDSVRTSALEHDWGEWERVSEPARTAAGLERRVCERDATHVEEREVPSLNQAAYGTDDVKLLYTRPYTVTPGTAGASVLISTTNPDVDGCDFAVRYTGTTPRLVFTRQWYFSSEKSEMDSAMKGWAHIAPYKTYELDGGEKVSLYSRADADAAWAANAEAQELALPYNNLFVWRPDGTWDGEGDCTLVEVAALGVPAKTAPAMRDASDVRTAAEIVADMGAGYNFSGSFEGQVPDVTGKDGGYGQADLNLEIHGREGEHWPYLTEEMFAAVKARGFSTVRLPCTWWQHLYAYGDDPYHIDEAWLARVHEVVDYALANDLYVIVDTHHEPWLEREDFGSAYDEIVPVFDAVWAQIAREFEGYDQRLIFEGMNEPRARGASVSAEHEWNAPTAEDIATVNRLNAHFAELIHETLEQPERIVLCSAYGGHPDAAQISGFEVPAGDAVAVSLHPYTPFSYAHDTSNANAASLESVSKPYTGENAEELDRVMEGVRTKFTNNGTPVVFDEFGSFYYGDANEEGRAQWMRQWATWAKALGAPGVIWPMESASQHYTFDRASCAFSQVNEPLLEIWFGTLEDESIPWGSNTTTGGDDPGNTDDPDKPGDVDDPNKPSGTDDPTGKPGENVKPNQPGGDEGGGDKTGQGEKGNANQPAQERDSDTNQPRQGSNDDKTSSRAADSSHSSRSSSNSTAKMPTRYAIPNRSASKTPVSPVFHLSSKRGDHLYVTSSKSMIKKKRAGWRYEGIAFYAPKSGQKVYQLVNRKTKVHYYVKGAKNAKKLKKKGWKSKGVAFRCLKSGGVAVYRMKNKHTGAFQLAKGKAEAKLLKKKGWKSKGVAFRASR